MRHILLTIVTILYGLVLDTHMWNMVMPEVFHLPRLGYAEMFVACVVLRFLLSGDYTTAILWNNYLRPMDETQKKNEVYGRAIMYISGQTIQFIIVWGLTTLCL